MKTIVASLIIPLSFWMLTGCEKSPQKKTNTLVEVYAPVAVPKSKAQKIFMHYMPWYETPETNSDNTWGIHWTMANRNPNVMEQGKRQIASHFYPLIGPYASSDKDVIEYHLLLMKYAGIDGLMIDWYGVHDVYDYPLNKRNTEAIVGMLEKVGLEFSIVYEDRTLPNVVEQNASASLVAAAQTDMQYLQNEFFSKSFYTRVNNQPLLLVFGPITLETPDQWSQVFSALNPKPCFLTLWNESADAGENATGEYAWVYMDNGYLDDFYDHRMDQLEMAIGSAYPGFIDYYNQGGWQDHIGWKIEHENGTVLKETLQKADDAHLDYLQLITWNDFGEGTMIEPTLKFGFDYIDMIRNHAGVSAGDGIFEAIHKLYLLRKEFVADQEIQRQLDQAFYYLVSLKTQKAIELLNTIAL